MARTHPPTLITRARAALRDYALAPRGSTVLVAVSGGPDSMALLHVLSILRAREGFGLFAHGVDHGLREQAAAELDLAADFATALEVPFTREKVDVAAGGNLHARARDVRWASLRIAASRAGAGRIATGHHADDRAETVVMRLLRGTGTRGLAVLPPIDGDRIRPFIHATRWDIEAHLSRHRIQVSRDPSNDHRRFLRSRVRHELMPELVRLSPRIVDHLCALADDAAAVRNGLKKPYGDGHGPSRPGSTLPVAERRPGAAKAVLGPRPDSTDDPATPAPPLPQEVHDEARYDRREGKRKSRQDC